MPDNKLGGWREEKPPKSRTHAGDAKWQNQERPRVAVPLAALSLDGPVRPGSSLSDKVDRAAETHRPAKMIFFKAPVFEAFGELRFK
jgi:hypothetical protein